METGLTLFQTVTLVIALMGAVLGVINTWQVLSKSRVRLKILPAHAIPVGGADERLTFCIEITNLSAFPVTVEDAGVLYRGTSARSSIVHPVFADGGHWPRRLEPRSSITVYSHKPGRISDQPIKCAYAKTQCGVTATGNSAALRQIANES